MTETCSYWNGSKRSGCLTAVTAANVMASEGTLRINPRAALVRDGTFINRFGGVPFRYYLALDRGSKR
ncbi:hypothetical protein AB4Z21_26305 [Paenibacillus sp. MCAF20]